LVGNPKGKRPLGKLIRRWVYYIERNLREKGRSGIMHIDLVEHGDQWRTLKNMAMNLWVPKICEIFQ
jgi:hypothetical protein